MDISNFYGYFVFHSFDDFVNWFCSYVPFVLLVIFVLNVFFNILYHIIHIGRK